VSIAQIMDADAAVADIADGSTVLIGGFGTAGQPVDLIDALRRHGASGLTVVNNNAGNGDVGLAALLKAGQVRKIICSFPRQADSWVFDELYRSGRIELELVPQGNLAERMRAAGAGIGAFYTPTGAGTALAEGKECRTIDGRDHHADSFAMMRGGHLDVCVLGAFQVSAAGDLANWSTGAPDAIPAVGGAMDLAIGARNVYVIMTLFAKDGSPKLVPACTYPITGLACVNRLYTDYGTFALSGGTVQLTETFGITGDALRKRLKVDLRPG
jgi:3-oxoadipate CoA-transferase alpha subunit